jgi:predicted nucleic acid-binding protein
MGSSACSDTGPILHLHELGNSGLLGIFSKVYTSGIVKSELLRRSVKLGKKVIVQDVNNDQTVMLAKRYDLGLGEASILALCKALQVPIMLTDDLEAREVAKQLNIQPTGTIGIILRGYRKKIINYNRAKELLLELSAKSSLFITSNLIAYAVKELGDYKKKKM